MKNNVLIQSVNRVNIVNMVLILIISTEPIALVVRILSKMIRGIKGSGVRIYREQSGQALTYLLVPNMSRYGNGNVKLSSRSVLYSQRFIVVVPHPLSFRPSFT